MKSQNHKRLILIVRFGLIQSWHACFLNNGTVRFTVNVRIIKIKLMKLVMKEICMLQYGYG